MAESSATAESDLSEPDTEENEGSGFPARVAMANSVNPYAYLKYVFINLPNASTDGHLDELMPWAIEPVELDALLVPPTVRNP